MTQPRSTTSMIAKLSRIVTGANNYHKHSYKSPPQQECLAYPSPIPRLTRSPHRSQPLRAATTVRFTLCPREREEGGCGHNKTTKLKHNNRNNFENQQNQTPVHMPGYHKRPNSEVLQPSPNAWENQIVGMASKTVMAR